MSGEATYNHLPGRAHYNSSVPLLEPVNDHITRLFETVKQGLRPDIRKNTALLCTLENYMRERYDVVEEMRKAFGMPGEVHSYVNLADVIMSYDSKLYHHSANVASLTRMMGEFMGLDDATINRYVNASIGHDIGRLIIPKIIAYGPRYEDGSFEQKIVKEGHVILSEVVARDLGITDPVEFSGIIHHHDILPDGYPHQVKNVGNSAHTVGTADGFENEVNKTGPKIVSFADGLAAALENRANYQETAKSYEHAIEMLRERGFKGEFLDIIGGLIAQRFEELNMIFSPGKNK